MNLLHYNYVMQRSDMHLQVVNFDLQDYGKIWGLVRKALRNECIIIRLISKSIFQKKN